MGYYKNWTEVSGFRRALLIIKAMEEGTFTDWHPLDMAKKFGVSYSTAKRDFKILKELGFIILEPPADLKVDSGTGPDYDLPSDKSVHKPSEIQE